MVFSAPGDNPDWLDAAQTIADDITPTGLSGVATASFDIILTPNKSYQGLLLVANSPGNTDHSTITVRIKDISGTQLWSKSYTWTWGIGTFSYNLPVPCVAGGNIDVTVAQASGTVTPSAFKLYGLNQAEPPNIKRRADGYYYPVGSSAAEGTNVLGATLVAAPGLGSRIILKSIQGLIQAPAAGSAYSILNCTITGTVIAIGKVGCPANGQIGHFGLQWESGILLDYNTSLFYSQAGSPTVLNWDAVYDFVG